jgi:hypothetical protein
LSPFDILSNFTKSNLQSTTFLDVLDNALTRMEECHPTVAEVEGIFLALANCYEVKVDKANDKRLDTLMKLEEQFLDAAEQWHGQSG